MTLLVAPDSFKGTFSASAVAAAICAGAGDADACPVADGGEGTLEALTRTTRRVTVRDPLGRPVDAAYGILEAGRVAVVEMAAAGGLGLVAEAERDAETASTYGVGELIAAAIAGGAREVVVAVGGSATSDGGAGAVAALEALGGLRGARIVVVCDVTTPFERAAVVYGPQKGASPEAVERLTARLNALAETFPRDPRGVPMTGAAGGLSGGLWAAFGASLVPGAAWVLDAVGFDARLAACSAVVTGEGRLDAQTFEGKLVGEVAARARAAGKPVHAVVGSSALSDSEAAALGLASVTVASDLPALRAAGAALAAG